MSSRLVDVMTVSKMKPAREHSEHMRRLAERDIGPVEPDLAIRHVDADAAVAMSERVVREVKVDGFELLQRAHG